MVLKLPIHNQTTEPEIEADHNVAVSPKSLELPIPHELQLSLAETVVEYDLG